MPARLVDTTSRARVHISRPDRAGQGDDMRGNDTCRATKTVVESRRGARRPTIVHHPTTFNLQDASSRPRRLSDAVRRHQRCVSYDTA